MNISALALGEIQYGITLLEDGKKKNALIACTAIEFSLTLVTRNVSDFRNMDVTLLNLWA